MFHSMWIKKSVLRYTNIIKQICKHYQNMFSLLYLNWSNVLFLFYKTKCAPKKSNAPQRFCVSKLIWLASGAQFLQAYVFTKFVLTKEMCNVFRPPLINLSFIADLYNHIYIYLINYSFALKLIKLCHSMNN